jgi:hypothetical protein
VVAVAFFGEGVVGVDEPTAHSDSAAPRDCLGHVLRVAHGDKRTYRPWADLSDHASSAYDPLRTCTRVARRASPEEAPIGAQHESTM